jgi:hypothetical protein
MRGEVRSGMKLHIDDPEAIQLANEIADQTGTTPEQAVIDALRHAKERLPRPRKPVDEAKLRAILADLRSLPVRDPRPIQELYDEMYDEWGQPK